MEWLKKLSDAIAYIEDHLDDEISYEEAARIACCSAYYFQRMFTYVAGISLAEYIRRRRMTQAAFELQRTGKKIMDIALKYGYASPTSFHRAFQKIHGISPNLARNKGVSLNAYPAIKFSVSVTGGNSMIYRMEQKEEMRIVGVRVPLTEDMEENQRNIPIFWQDTLKRGNYGEICSLSNQEPQGILGVSAYQNPQDIYYYIAVSTDSPVPEGMYECMIPASTWVVFENVGRFKESVQSIFRRFYTDWLMFSGYEYAGLPDIEVYPVSADQPADGHFEVWIAVKKEGEKQNGCNWGTESNKEV